MKGAALFLAVAVVACAPIEQRPPEQRTTVVQVPTPIPVPCFTEAERPVMAPPTQIDMATATVDQMAAAMAADDIAERLFTEAVDALFLKCLKSGGTK